MVAMVSVAEQFSNLRTTIGSILGIFTLLRYLRTLFAKVTGRPPPADATSLTPSAFASFQGLSSPSSPNQPPTPSRKPLLIFLAAVFGLPYLMTKLIRSLAAQSSQNQNQPYNPVLGPDGQPLPEDQQPHNQRIDPSKLDFCRVLYDYTPENNPPTPGIDLEVKKGDLVAVLSKSDPMGNASDWWRCRARDGRMGYLPDVYLETVKRKPVQPQAQIEDGARINTMTTLAGGASGEGSRTNSLKEKVAVKGGGGGPGVEGLGKVGDISAESFQKSQFYH